MSETRDTLPTSGDAFPAATSTPTGSLGATGSAAPSTGTSNLDTAKREAGNVVDTAKDQAAGVAQTAKEEAKEVGREARAQVSRLYDNARHELRSQAETRQTQLAEGLRSAGDELRGLAEGRTDVNAGMATDIVREVSHRLDGAASWLGSRDPGAVLDEVKRYARRRPVVFLAVAALAGVVVGRLTRAVAAGAPDSDTYGRPQLTTGYGSTGNGAPATSYGTGATYGNGAAGTAAYGTGATYGTGAAGTTPGAYDTDAAGGLGGATAVGDTSSQRLRSSGTDDSWEVKDGRSDNTV